MCAASLSGCYSLKPGADVRDGGAARDTCSQIISCATECAGGSTCQDACNAAGSAAAQAQYAAVLECAYAVCIVPGFGGGGSDAGVVDAGGGPFDAGDSWWVDAGGGSFDAGEVDAGDRLWFDAGDPPFDAGDPPFDAGADGGSVDAGGRDADVGTCESATDTTRRCQGCVTATSQSPACASEFRACMTGR